MKILEKKRAFNIGNLLYGVIAVIIVVVMIPIVTTTITDSKTSGMTNYTGTQLTLLNLVPTLLVVGLIIGALVFAGLKIANR